MAPKEQGIIGRRVVYNQIEMNCKKVKRLENKRKSDLTKKTMKHECYQQMKKSREGKLARIQGTSCNHT